MEKYSKQWLTKEEWERMISLPVLELHEKVMLNLLYGCALRVSELCALQVEDIHPLDKEIVIKHSKKEPDPRVVPITADETFSLIQEHIKKRKLLPCDYLMQGRFLGRKVSRKTIYQWCRAIAEAAFVEKKIGTHTFRRSRATHLIEAGMRIEWVQQLLRHKDIRATQVYLNLSAAQLRKEIEKAEGSR